MSIPCVGNGAQRWKFQASSYQYDASDKRLVEAPRRSPSNDRTRTTSALVCILEIDDQRYDIRTYGAYFIPDLPRRLGSNSTLDASISALVASYNAVQLKQPKQNALTLYGTALKALRESLQDPTQSVAIKMEAVYLIFLWMDRKHAEKHREMLSYLLQDVVSQGKLHEIDPRNIHGLCIQVISESFINPKVELGPWFWDLVSKDLLSSRPYCHHHQGKLISLELGTSAELSVYLRQPERYLDQIKCIHEVFRLERPRLRHVVEECSAVVLSPTTSHSTKKAYLSYWTAYGGMLATGLVTARVLHAFRADSSCVEEVHDLCDDAILMAQRWDSFRPCAASWVPELLKIAWAAVANSYRRKEVEELIVEYEKDMEGANFLEQARDIRDRLDRLGRADEKKDASAETEMEEAPACIIL
ncbi:hypothetical protein ACJ41O_014560 [Fusarium nematophilum]